MMIWNLTFIVLNKGIRVVQWWFTPSPRSKKVVGSPSVSVASLWALQLAHTVSVNGCVSFYAAL